VERVLIVQALAITAWLLCIPVCYFSRRKEDRLRSPRGALAWAATDGFEAWATITLVSAATWTADAYTPGKELYLIPAALSIIVALALMVWFSPFVLKFFARILGG